jgi:transcriptional regulator with XRE-family HTH domain
LTSRDARPRVRSVGSRGGLERLEGDRRFAAGLTLDAITEELGTTRQAVGNIERGHTRAGVPTLLALAELFRVGIDDFFEPVSSLSVPSRRLPERSEELLQVFASIDDPEMQWVVLALSRTLAREAANARRRRRAKGCGDLEGRLLHRNAPEP